MRIFQILALTLLPLSSFAVEDDGLEKYSTIYKNWSKSLYNLEIDKQKKYLSPELAKRLSYASKRITTKQSLDCKSYLVSHNVNYNEGAPSDQFNLLNSTSTDEGIIELNVFNECSENKSTSITHVSGINVHIGLNTKKITQYQIKTHKNNKNGLSDQEIENSFSLFTDLSKPKEKVDLKSHNFTEDIERLKKQNQ